MRPFAKVTAAKFVVGTAAVLALALPARAPANPVGTPIPGSAEVAELIPEIAAGTSAERQHEFAEHMLAGGDRIVWENAELLGFILENFPAFDIPLAEYFTAQIASGGTPSANQHSWYRRGGPVDGRAMICDALKIRLEAMLEDCLQDDAATHGWLSREHHKMDELLGVVEVASDYGESRFQEELDELTALLAAPGVGNLETHEFKLWWYVHHAAARLRDPVASRVAVADDSGVVRVCRASSDAVSASMHGQELSAETQRLILAALEGSRRASYIRDEESSAFKPWRTELRFSDGALAAVTPTLREGIVEYEDNLRLTGNRYQLESPQLYELIRGLGREAEVERRAAHERRSQEVSN